MSARSGMSPGVQGNPLFTVAILGKPNVGKSTLFNRLVGRRQAIVHPTPGVTRDRLYGLAVWLGHSFRVMDAAGYPSYTSFLEKNVRNQYQGILQEADLLLLVTDATTGITEEDWVLARLLQRSRKRVWLAVNKVDQEQRELDAQVFRSLGVQPIFFISALHGRGVDNLLDEIARLIPETPVAGKEPSLTLAIIGRRNVGKSTLMNAILGEERAQVSPVPGTTRDAVESLFTWKNHLFRLVDTAGLALKFRYADPLDYYSEIRSRGILRSVDVVMFLLNASEGITRTDKRIGGFLKDQGKCLLIAVNKFDLFQYRKSFQKKFISLFHQECPFLNFVPLLFISALKKWNIEALLEKSVEISSISKHRIPAPELYRLLKDYVFSTPLPSRGKKRLTVSYIAQTQGKSPRFLLFVNDKSLIKDSFYQGFERYIRQFYPFEGVPFRFTLREKSSKIKWLQ